MIFNSLIDFTLVGFDSQKRWHIGQDECRRKFLVLTYFFKYKEIIIYIILVKLLPFQHKVKPMAIL
ncbi:hypothetical protein BpHYR1_043021 [Brachionus plicatilis]|uniref:Uncharacterized protein n=1 Tax=Brachionus plicatilis TaxID=10195 RepID=A0A3M7REH8_BRAPC|nr:hypothetical protein BpHYR1_043021 [Brachionus plicatilis]